jgi:hypothetical protein
LKSWELNIMTAACWEEEDFFSAKFYVLFRRLGRKGVSGDLKFLIQWDIRRELWTEAGK